MDFAFDFLVVGAGMAGVSVAAHLAHRGRVAVLEREEQPGYHATGRSAALFSEIYGNKTIRALTRASRSFLFDPPEHFCASPVVHRRATLYFARMGRMDSLRRFQSKAGVLGRTSELSAQRVREMVPAFRDSYVAGALYEEGSADIAVSELQQGYLRQLRARGGELRLGCPIESLQRSNGRWVASTQLGTFSAPVIVNAAGAWGDEVARLAGVAPVGLEPKRRTALLVDVPGDRPAAAWPAVIDVEETFYFKPDAGLLLLSPADEHASTPCDSQPEELDVAIAVARFEEATGQPVRRVRNRWAGLRSFVADRTPVVGFDETAPGFFWLVGQGGYGIQTAPALSRWAAALASASPLPTDIVDEGVEVEALSRRRLGPMSADPATVRRLQDSGT